jgi:hypothetical protein
MHRVKTSLSLWFDMCKLTNEFPNTKIKDMVYVAWLGLSDNSWGENRWIWKKGGIIIIRGKLQKLLRRTFSRPVACVTNLAWNYLLWNARLSCEKPNSTAMLVKLLLWIREIQGPNPGQETGCPYWCLSKFSSIPFGAKFRECVSN